MEREKRGTQSRVFLALDVPASKKVSRVEVWEEPLVLVSAEGSINTEVFDNGILRKAFINKDTNTLNKEMAKVVKALVNNYFVVVDEGRHIKVEDVHALEWQMHITLEDDHVEEGSHTVLDYYFPRYEYEFNKY